MFNLFSWVTDLVETFTFYGGGGKGGSSSSSSQPVDFFGKGDRAPYANLLAQLLGVGGGTIGSTQGYYTNGSGSNNSQGQWVTTLNAWGQTQQSWQPKSGGGKDKNGIGNSGVFVPGTPGMSIGDYIKQTPGYQFGMTQGQETLERSFAASGFGNNGAQSIALQNYGNQYAGQAYQQLINNLMPASGASLIGNSSTSQSTGADPTMGALGTIVGAGIMRYSDKNLKTNIKHINTINGIKIYSFNYIWSYIKSIGVMAQDLLEMPQYKHAVHTTNIGYVVDYSKLPI